MLGVALTVGTVSTAISVAASEADPSKPRIRYEMRAVRVESPWKAVLYRLDAETGEVCAFSFAPRGAGGLRGCGAAAVEHGPGRYWLDAAAGAKGTSESSAYRLDRVTGEICRFRLSLEGSAVLEVAGCVASPPKESALD